MIIMRRKMEDAPSPRCLPAHAEIVRGYVFMQLLFPYSQRCCGAVIFRSRTHLVALFVAFEYTQIYVKKGDLIRHVISFHKSEEQTCERRLPANLLKSALDKFLSDAELEDRPLTSLVKSDWEQLSASSTSKPLLSSTTVLAQAGVAGRRASAAERISNSSAREQNAADPAVVTGKPEPAPTRSLGPLFKQIFACSEPSCRRVRYTSQHSVSLFSR